MAIKEVNPQEAYELLSKEADCVYIDVRTEGEFAAGHPEGGVNIPVAFPSPAGGMALNRDFVKVVEAHFPKDKKVIVGCQAGPRADAAARMLDEAGYPEVFSMQGGFGGMRDPFGNVVVPGWSSLGLPVSRENSAGASYQSLAAKIKD